jgi:hypothetical protein
MTYSLGFAPDFFLAEGEPYDRSDRAVNPKGQPYSVWSAIHMMPDDRWAEMAKEVFGLDDPDFLEPETVLDKIRETDTCSNLTVPVTVWIDEEGYYTIDVYEETVRT